MSQENLALPDYVNYLILQYNTGKLQGKHEISLHIPHSGTEAYVELGSANFSLLTNDTPQADLQMLGEFTYQLVEQWIYRTEKLEGDLRGIFKIILDDYIKGRKLPNRTDKNMFIKDVLIRATRTKQNRRKLGTGIQIEVRFKAFNKLSEMYGSKDTVCYRFQIEEGVLSRVVDEL